MERSLKEKKMTVREVSALAGVSVRTLHYYDAIGLLKPETVSDAGYRLYSTADLERLQDIMLLRELEFPLKEIEKIINDPVFNRKKALREQIRLLELRRDRLEDLIRYARKLEKEERGSMSFEPFNKEKIESYRKLAKETWGQTEAYREFEQKDVLQTDTDRRRNSEALMDIFYEFGDMKEKDPAEPEVQAQVKKLQEFITAHYYTCTDQILLSLGQMYTAGDEMTLNIDAAGGEGCAEFVNRAISVYCGKEA